MFFLGYASDARFKHLHVYEVKHKEAACAYGS
jgi:hypothetical protein